MPLTDAPNSVSEFGWRKPHPRRTPPWAGPLPFFCRGRAPSRPAGKGAISRQFPLVPKRLPHRVGADLCVRPPPSSRDPYLGRHTGRPLQIRLQPSSTPENRAGTEPRPYSRRMPVRDLPGHPQPRLPQGEMPGMTTGTPLSSVVPCSNVLRNRNPRKLRDGFQRRAQPSLWS